MLEQNLAKAIETTMAVITAYGLKIIGAIFILIVGWTVSGWVHRAIVKAGQRTPRIDITIFTFMASLAKYAILIFAVVAMLSSFGVQTTSFVAVLGAASLAIGLALQGTLGHVASGLMIIVFRPFRIGDQVEMANVAGTVVEISLFTTEIRTPDNIKVIVPNSAVWRDTIKNLSSHETRRVAMEVAMPYATDTEDIIKDVAAAIRDDPRVLKDPPLAVTVSKVTEAAVTLLVELWVARKDYQAMRLEVNRRAKQVLDRKRAG